MCLFTLIDTTVKLHEQQILQQQYLQISQIVSLGSFNSTYTRIVYTHIYNTVTITTINN